MAKVEIHNAIVSRNQSLDFGTKLRGAIFFEAPTLFDGEYPLPAFPCFPFASANGAGFFFVPRIGDEVEIVINVDDGTDDTTDIELPEPRWRCMVYSEAADIADEFKKNYPFRMGWKTSAGHILLFDDTKGEEFVQIQSGSGHNFLLDDANEKIILSHLNGTKLEIDKDGNWLENIIKDKVLTILGDLGITVTGDCTENISGKKVFNITGDIEINCVDAKVNASGSAKIDGTTVELNGSGGRILTTLSDPIIDNIVGALHIGVTSVFAE